MDKNIRKNKNFKWFIITFIVAALVITFITGFLFIKYRSRISSVVDVCIVEDESIYYLSYRENQRSEVRKVSLDGSLMGRFELRRNNSYIFYLYDHITSNKDKVFLYEYENDTRRYLGLSESIYSFDFKTMKSKIIYTHTFAEDEPSENINVVSLDVHDDYVYFINQSADKCEIYVRRVHIDGWDAQLYKTITLDNPMEIKDAYYAENGSVFVTTPASEIYCIEDESVNLIYKPVGYAAMVDFFASGNGDLYFVLSRFDEQCIYKNEGGNTLFTRAGELEDTVKHFDAADEFTFLSVDLNAAFRVRANINNFNYNSLQVALKFLLDIDYIGALLVCLIIVYVVMYYSYLHIIHARIRVFKKQLLFSLPVLVIGIYVILIFSYSRIYKLIEKKTYETIQLELNEQQEVIDNDRFRDINWARPFDDPYYLEVRELMFDLSRYKTQIIYKNQEIDAPSEVTYNFVNYWIYWVKDGKKAYAAVCDYDYVNQSVDSMQDEKSSSMCQFVIDNGVPAYDRVNDLSGEGTWLSVMVPLFDSSGEVVGVIEASCTTTMMEYQVITNLIVIMSLTVGVIILLYAIYMIVMKIVLKSLMELKQGTIELTNGNYGYIVKCDSRDEIYDIAEAFNDMSLKTREKIEDLSLINHGYYRFVPSKFFEILGKQKIQNIDLGDQKNIDTGLMIMKAYGLDTVIEDMSSEAFVNHINKFYSHMIPVINENKGIIERYSEKELIALFTGEPVLSVNAAVAMQKALTEFNTKETLPYSKPVEMVITLSYSDVLVGIIGNSYRFNTTIVSKAISFAEKFEEIGRKFGIKIIVTKDMHDKLDEISGLNHRIFGYVHLGGLDIPVYDYFDGDDYELLYCKKNTLADFEGAVELYRAGKYYDAKNKFIEVIKQSPYDLASREYLVRCDENLQEDVSKLENVQGHSISDGMIKTKTYLLDFD